MINTIKVSMLKRHILFMLELHQNQVLVKVILILGIQEYQLHLCLLQLTGLMLILLYHIDSTIHMMVAISTCQCLTLKVVKVTVLWL
jgi:hypothetical protein